MGLGEKLKDIYYAGEEKWYNFWDKIDSHIPVYKIIDPIDSIVPSFALFLILIFIILLLLGNLMFGIISAGQAEINVNVVDNFGTPIEGATVEIAGVNTALITNTFGLTENVLVNYGQINVTATKGDKTKTDLFLIQVGDDPTIQLILPSDVASFSQKSIMFKTESGDLATGEISLTFNCSSGVTEGVPATQTIFGGTTNIAQPDSCGTLTVSVSSPKYNSDTFTLSGASGYFTLTDKVAKTQVKVIVNLTYNSANITDAVSVQAFSSGNSYIPVDTEITINGQASFDLIEGDYIFKTAAEKGYKVSTSSLISLTKEGGQKTVTLPLEKLYLGAVRAIIKEGSQYLSGARVALTKTTTLGTTQEIWAYDTNSSGIVNFDVSEEGPFTIIATKEGYCDKSITAAIGAEVILSMKRYDGTCGHELKVKVVDSDGKPVQFAKVALFSETSDDLQKLSYAEKITDFNGVAKWNPVRKSAAGEKYKAFAFKSVYSGWSSAKELNATTSSEEFIVRLDIPLGIVRVTVKDLDGDALQFSEVQIFDEYNAGAVSGKRIIENIDGTIDFNIKADKMVYAVIKKEGYESYTTLPKQIIGNGLTNFEAKLSRPPIDALVVKPLGFYKNGLRAQKVEANQEYDVLFEITAPKDYDELGFFVRVGKDYTTKTEMDKIYIKEVYAGGLKTILTGGTYNKPKGYNIDEVYLNLEESKWAQVRWDEDGFVRGKIIVGIKVKIRQTAQQEERIDLGYRAWGVMDGDYERDPFDNELNTAEHTSAKQALYALTKPDYITVGIETLCDSVSEERSFCITSTYTDPEGFTYSFNDSFNALNNTPYSVSINVMNNSLVGFDNAKIMIENPEENIMMGGYILKTPKNETKQATLGAYKTEWIDVSGFDKGLSIDIMDLNIVPQKTGTGTLLLKIREQNSLVFEKAFSVNVSSDKKMTLTYMKDGKFDSVMPKVISGKFQILTIKARNAANNLEISDAIVKIFDRFGTKIFTTTTNALGVASLDIPASFPGEKLTIKVEKSEYETFITEFSIEEDVVTIEPTELTYTVNPQYKKEEIQTVKLTNQTGLDLTVKSIVLTGKLKGLLNESKMESWFDQYIGKKILSQDFEEFDFKVISSDYVPTAADIEGKFLVTLTSEGKSWVQEVTTKIRVGLGKDVDNQNCLQITPSNWEAQTRGNMVELGVELKNNCTVDGKPVQLKNLGLTLNSTGTIAGDFTAIYRTAQVELGTAYARVLKPTVTAGEKVPMMLRFTPLAGSSGTATGTIILEAQNNTDSAPQKITTEVKFNIIYENLQDCMSLGAGLISISPGESGTFSVINSCQFASDVQIDSGDLQAAISDKTFTLKAGETKEVSVIAQEGQMAGAYNLLVFARQKGSNLELLDNVKVIVDSTGGCFTLTRYEYDVYDSEFNNFDGIDRGYLKNSCVQKSTGAHVTGIVPFDNWQSILTAALIGGISGWANSGKFFPDWMSRLWEGNPSTNLSEKTDQVKATLQGKLAEQAVESVGGIELVRSEVIEDINNTTNKYDAWIAAIDKEIVKIEAKNTGATPAVQTCNNNYIGALTASKTTLETQKQEKLAQMQGIQQGFEGLINDVKTNQEQQSREVNLKFEQMKAKINIGANVEQGKTALESSQDQVYEVMEENEKAAQERGEKAKELVKKSDEIKASVDNDINAIKTKLKTDVDAYNDCIKTASNSSAPPAVSQTPAYPAFESDKAKCLSVFGAAIYDNKKCENGNSDMVDEGVFPTGYHCCGKLPITPVISKTPAYPAFESDKAKCLSISGAISYDNVKCLNKTKDMVDEGVFPTGYHCCGRLPIVPEAAAAVVAESSIIKTDAATSKPATAVAPASNKSVVIFSFKGFFNSEGKFLGNRIAEARKKNTSGVEPIYSLGRFFNPVQQTSFCKIMPFRTFGDYYISYSGSADCTNNDVKTLCNKIKPYSTNEAPPQGYCKGMTSSRSSTGITKLNCNWTFSELYEVRSKSGTTLGYVFSESEAKEMLAASEASVAKTSTQPAAVATPAAIPAATSAANAASKPTTYTVKESDTVDSIALQFNFASQFIKDENPGLVNSQGKIAAGTVLNITYDPTGEILQILGPATPPTGQFLLATSTSPQTSSAPGIANNGPTMQDAMGGALFNTAISAGVGAFGGSALGGAFAAALLALMQAKDTEIDFSETFFVPRVVITGFSLESPDGISVNSYSSDAVTYDFASSGGASTQSNSGTVAATNSGNSSAMQDSSYTGNALFNPQGLNATMGLEEVVELEFTNGGKKVNKSPNEPFVGVLTVTGEEAIYETDYDYADVKKKAIARGEKLKVKRSGVFGKILDFLGGPGIIREKTATIVAEDLEISETLPYSKKFHLLFDSYEYVDCGPTTYPCTAKELSNCDVDGKNGYTGEEGIPLMKLAWNWSDIGVSECDSDSNPNNYNYCDTTQFSIMVMKRLMELKEFFNSTSLNNCPSSNEILGLKTQDLAVNDLDVGITSVEIKSTASGALIKSVVQTNNNLEMSAKMNYVVKGIDGNQISGVCLEQTQTFKSSVEFSCELNKSITGEGSFTVDLIMTPTLCSGCGNRSTGNDTIRTALVIGSTGSSQCLKYATSKDYFEKVLSANNILNTSEGSKVLNYISFKANLVRDGFSEDFKADFDEFLNRVTSAPVEYTTGGFRDLLLSDKFQMKWPEKPAAWDAGKYDATITITFKNNNWTWDNNNIETIVINLSPQGPPEKDFAIYKVAFNGIVGLDSDNGRQGYGAGYEQLTEDLFLVTDNGGTKVYARPNASNNAATIVQVSTIKGNAAFDLLNTVPTRGNVLSISGDDVVQFVLTPSVAVPLIMNITRNQSTDAYAFYSAEVNGQPQNTGGSFISWTGIGQGCVDFEGRSMNSYSNTYDTLASGSVTGFTGYGLPAWTMVQRAGTASFFGAFFAPQDSSTIFKLTGANESASFESTMGNGTILSINSSNATDKIATLSDVLDLVKQEKVCVVGGEYYWNNFGLRDSLEGLINSKEASCIPSRN